LPRRRKVEALGGDRKAAAVDDLNEGAYADKPIHGNSCMNESFAAAVVLT